MDQYKSPVDRSNFIITEKKEYNHYSLFSEKYNESFEVNFNFLDNVDRPEIDDILELPDCMLYEDIGRPMFSIHELSFGIPCDRVAIPDGFNIEEDYAYLTYKKKNKRLLLQRYYC